MLVALLVLRVVRILVAIMETEVLPAQHLLVEVEEVYVLLRMVVLIALITLEEEAALELATTVAVEALVAVSMPTVHIMEAQQVEVAVSEKVEMEEIPVVLIPDITVAAEVLALADQVMSAVFSRMPQHLMEM